MIILTGDAPNSPVTKPPPKTQTKGKWLKLTRKGLLVNAISRVGKITSKHHKTIYYYYCLDNAILITITTHYHTTYYCSYHYIVLILVYR